MGNDLFAVTVRAFYKKQGRIKYISHLDLVRCISRVLKRSGLPVWHTLGFHPHVYLTFALPLALGYESEYETMDFRLTVPIPMQEVVDRLNAVLPEGLTVFKAAPAKMKPDVICWAEYQILQEFDSIPVEKVLEKFQNWCEQNEIFVVKKTKKGEKTLNAKPHFCIYDLCEKDNALSFGMRCAAGNTFNLNPTVIFDAFATETGMKADWMRVIRLKITDNNFRLFE